MAKRVNLWGFVIAGLGFFLTRFTVTLAIDQEPLRFYFAGVIPLLLGLGLAAFGVALAFADVDRRLVRTTALWSIAGAGSMLLLVVLTLLGSAPNGMPTLAAIRSQTYLSNFLIGGSIGGTLTGLYAARNREQRVTLLQQTRRLEVLNRILRHEVLNSLNVIEGYAETDGGQRTDADAVIKSHSEAIERTIDEVKYLTQSAGTDTATATTVDLARCLESAAATVRSRHPEATIEIAGHTDSLQVRATDRLERVFLHLLDNAVVHDDTENPHVRVEITPAPNAVSVSVTDEGPGLPEPQRRLLDEGEIHEYDDPSTGFGLNVVRLLMESFNGDIETTVTEANTIVTVSLQRARTDTIVHSSSSGLVGVRPALPHLLVTLVAALLAGVAYGVAAELQGGSIAGIGVFYGVPDPVVGWLTHEFHSVVFGFMFAGLISIAPVRYRNRAVAYLGIGILWGATLWIGAAGVIAPLWLQLLGIPADIPNLSGSLLVNHLVWGVTVGGLTLLGYRYVVPPIERAIADRR